METVEGGDCGTLFGGAAAIGLGVIGIGCGIAAFT